MGDPFEPATSPDGANAAKTALRSAIRARRAARPEGERRMIEDSLARLALQRYGTTAAVAAYASYGTEPSTVSVRVELRSTGARVLLPVVRGAELAWVVDDGSALRRGGERGMPEPTGPAVGVGAGALLAAGCTVLLLPALAVGLDRIRLGQGGGFYDRLLAGLPAYPAGPLRVAVVHDDEVLPAGGVPADAHDRRALVDEVLTPGGVHAFTARER